MCNVSAANNSCADVDEIRSMAAKGRIFLFIEDTSNNISVSK